MATKGVEGTDVTVVCASSGGWESLSPRAVLPVPAGDDAPPPGVHHASLRRSVGGVAERKMDGGGVAT